MNEKRPQLRTTTLNEMFTPIYKQRDRVAGEVANQLSIQRILVIESERRGKRNRLKNMRGMLQ